MKVVFFGTPSFVIPVLEALIGNFDVVGVVTTPDSPQGRKKILTPSPIALYAQEHNIPVFQPENFQLRTSNFALPKADLFVTAAYGKLIPQEILNLPRLGSLNIHPSLLPKYRGTSPIQSAILNGDKETGVTIMLMDAKFDSGPILAQKKIQLQGDETFKSLHTDLFQLAADLLPSTIEQWSNETIKAIPQDKSKATYCKKITKEDGFFDIDNPPEKNVLDRMIRAYYPWPTAWSKWQIAHGKPARNASRSDAGGWKILKFLPGKKFQIEGGKPMNLKDFLNGYPQLKEQLEKILN